MILRHLYRAIMDFGYPSRCAACEADLSADHHAITSHGAAAGPLCPVCDADLSSLQAHPACRLCGLPLPLADGDCPYCFNRGVAHYEQVLRLATLGDPLRPLIHKIKYSRRWTLAEFLADRLRSAAAVATALQQADAVLPVPLHFRRRFERGFNQAEVFARHLARPTHLKLIQPVERVRDTPTQTRLSRQQREQNLRGAFALLDPRAVAGKHLLVIDDVMTTGATLRALAQALQSARPASLTAVVIAVADPRGRDFETI